MTLDEIKAFITEKVQEGLSLSKIQDLLNEKNEKMTFMELRLIASEIESGIWQQQEKKNEPQPKAEEAIPAKENIPDETEENEIFSDEQPQQPVSDTFDQSSNAGPRGNTTVTMSRIQRPGFLASGTVTFGSGASAEWFIDQTGRVGFDNLSGKPDKQDIQDFQNELQKLF